MLNFSSRKINRLKRTATSKSNFIRKFGKRKMLVNKNNFSNKRRIKNSLKNLLQTIFRPSIVRILVAFIFFVSAVMLLRFLLLGKEFAIEKINISGNSILEESLFRGKLSYIINQNIFFFRSSKLDEQIGKFSPYIKDVRVEKHLPNEINVSIEERKPFMVWINLSGAFLVDQDGVVVDIVSDFNDLNITEDDLKTLKGYGDLEEMEKDIKESDKEKKEDEENDDKKTDSEEAESTKQEAIDLLEEEKLEISSRVNSYWNSNAKLIAKKFKKYPFVYSYEKNDFSVMDQMDFEIVTDTKKIVTEDLNIGQVDQYLWESSYKFVIDFEEGLRIVFTTRRDIEEQLDELIVFVEELRAKGEKYSLIDLSSEVIVVK